MTVLPHPDGYLFFGKKGGVPAHIHDPFSSAVLDQRCLRHHHYLLLRPSGNRYGDGHPQLQPAGRVVNRIQEVRCPLEWVYDLSGVDGSSRPGQALFTNTMDDSQALSVNFVQVSFKDGGFDPNGGEVGDGKERSGSIDLLA